MYFIYFESRMTERYRNIILLVQKLVTKMVTRAGTSPVSYVGGRGPRTWATFCCISRQKAGPQQSLGLEQRSEDLESWERKQKLIYCTQMPALCVGLALRI